jgi:hypothetical protein
MGMMSGLPKAKPTTLEQESDGRVMPVKTLQSKEAKIGNLRFGQQ